AKAMSMPIEKVKYVGEKYGVACPVCHCNVIVIPKDFPYVVCPVCSIRGKVTTSDGKLKVRWNKTDTKNPRFSPDLVRHHFAWLGRHNGGDYSAQNKLREMSKEFESYSKIISPEKAA
ncbi:MAG TPA: hypothetical protein VJ488_05270, partial [Dehalococcoidia bacterium]|nr:hypothetical protein [Dehalococcoidia bacterium]